MCRSDLFVEAGALLWLYSTFKLECCDPTKHKHNTHSLNENHKQQLLTLKTEQKISEQRECKTTMTLLSGLAYILTCLSSGQFVTCGLRVSGQFVTPGSTAVQRIFHFLAKVHQTRQRPAASASPPPCKISARSRKWSTRCALTKFSLFGLGANPWANVHHKWR